MREGFLRYITTGLTIVWGLPYLRSTLIDLPSVDMTPLMTIGMVVSLVAAYFALLGVIFFIIMDAQKWRSYVDEE